MYIWPKLHFPENLFARIYTCQNVHLVEILFPRKLYFPEFTLASINIWPKLHFPESLFSKIYTSQNVHLIEITFPQKFIL